MFSKIDYTFHIHFQFAICFQSEIKFYVLTREAESSHETSGYSYIAPQLPAFRADPPNTQNTQAA